MQFGNYCVNNRPSSPPVPTYSRLKNACPKNEELKLSELLFRTKLFYLKRSITKLEDNKCFQRKISIQATIIVPWYRLFPYYVFNCIALNQRTIIKSWKQHGKECMKIIHNFFLASLLRIINTDRPGSGSIIQEAIKIWAIQDNNI